VTTVLIVDDHDGFRATAGALLAAGGFRVVGEASTGAEAVAATVALAPDVVLLDVRLPDRTGFAVSTEIMGRAPRTRVVLCSAHSPADYGPPVHECGAVGFVSKADLSAAALRAVVLRRP
jgi:DNA-binding NarL/FixJ family response regulator